MTSIESSKPRSPNLGPLVCRALASRFAERRMASSSSLSTGRYTNKAQLVKIWKSVTLTGASTGTGIFSVGYELIEPLHLNVLSTVVSLSYCSLRHVGKGQHEAALSHAHVITRTLIHPCSNTIVIVTYVCSASVI